MGAMRFGLMPSVKKNYNGASSHTAMVEQASTKNIGSRDPAGFTAVDVLAAGSFATIISAGEILAGQVPSNRPFVSLNGGVIKRLTTAVVCPEVGARCRRHHRHRHS